MSNAAGWLTGWLLFIIVLVAIAQTAIGNTFLYYLCWTAVVLLAVLHANEIASMFTAAGLGSATS